MQQMNTNYSILFPANINSIRRYRVLDTYLVILTQGSVHHKPHLLFFTKPHATVSVTLCHNSSINTTETYATMVTCWSVQASPVVVQNVALWMP